MWNTIRAYISLACLLILFGPFFLMSLAAESFRGSEVRPPGRERVDSVSGWLRSIVRGWCAGVIVGAVCLVPMFIAATPEATLSYFKWCNLWILFTANLGAFVGLHVGGRHETP